MGEAGSPKGCFSACWEKHKQKIRREQQLYCGRDRAWHRFGYLHAPQCPAWPFLASSSDARIRSRGNVIIHIEAEFLKEQRAHHIFVSLLERGIGIPSEEENVEQL